MAGSSRGDISDGVLAAGAEVTIVLGPEGFACLLVTVARGLPTLMARRQRRTG